MANRKWHKLDNVGKFYASISAKSIPNIFRYSATLNKNIDKDVLQRALEETILNYPNFNVSLRKGLFWYYLEENDRVVKVTDENLPICFRLYNNSDDILYRVSVFNNRINLEVSHIISDGRGSVEFFKVLITNYIKFLNNMEEYEPLIEASYSESSEDSYEKYYKHIKTKGIKGNSIYRYKDKKFKSGAEFMECHLSSKKLIDAAHKYNATLSSFLVSLLIYSFKDELKLSEMNKTIKIDVPVDLRKYFNAKTSKNFFGLTSVSYKFNGKDDKLEDIIDSVNKQFKHDITLETLSARANKMVELEKNPVLRLAPLVLKNFVLSIIDHYTSQLNSSSFSNIGLVKFDKDIEKYIKEINVLTSTNHFQFTAVTFKDNLSIGISSVYKYNDIIKNYCRLLKEYDDGIIINVSEVR